MRDKENIELVETVIACQRAGDWVTLASLYSEDATARMAGVPRSLGGSITGRDQIVEFAKRTQLTIDVRDIFGDDTHVCVVQKVSSDRFDGGQFLKSVDKQFSEWQCVVYRLMNGQITEVTTYANWMSVYVQTGLVDLASITS